MGTVFEYNERRYVAAGEVIVQPISEFNSGLRLGVQSRDDRNLASFFAFEDARAGIGQTIGEIREDKDRLADSDGLIFWKMNQAIKPPAYSLHAMSGATKTLATHTTIGEFNVDGTVRMLVGFGHQVWYSDGVDGDVVKTTADPYVSGDRVTSMVLYTTPVGGTRRLYLGNDAGKNIKQATDPTAGSPWTDTGSVRVAETLFVFDGKLWAHNQGVLGWTIDPATSWTGATATGAWPNRMRFIGIFQFGQTAYPYVLAEHHDPTQSYLAVLNLDANSVYPISLGVPAIVAAQPTKDGILVIYNHGRDALLYDPSNRSSRELDWRAQTRDGFVTERDAAAISGLGTYQTGTILTANLDETTEAQLFVQRGQGWHPYGRTLAGSVLYGSAYIPHLQRLVLPIVPAGADLELRSIPWWSEAFTPGVNQSVPIESTDLSFVTPWFSMGFSELAGTLLVLQLGGFADASNRITMEYQIDFDDNWQTLGTFPNTVPAEPEIAGRLRPVENATTLLFNTLSGVQFTWMRLRGTLISDLANQTPNAYPLTLRFFKRPDLRDSIRINVDVKATLGVRGDIHTVNDVLRELRESYDARIVPQLKVGSVETWAALIQMPRVLIMQDLDIDEDVVRGDQTADGIIALAFAELL